MKKILSIILLTAMLSATTLPVFADSGTVSASDNSEQSAPYSDWATDSVEKAISLNIIDYDINRNYYENITREAFCELIYNYCKNVANVISSDEDNVKMPFTDTANTHCAVLNAMGIINGKSETEFAPNDFLTREEAAAILCRLINKVYSDWAVTELYYIFDDEEQISDWAMSPVQTLCNLGIMTGVENNKFAPKDLYTTEQAITTIIRIYKHSNKSHTTFTDKLNKQMPADKNYMFSPLSIKTALLMAANGASGETLQEILDAADVDNLDEYNANIKNMIDLYSNDDTLIFNIANSIWLNSDQTSQKFSDEFTKTLSDNFYAVSDTVNNSNAVNKINSWVNDNTNGKIPTILNDDCNNFLVMLVNAVYFKGRWLYRFNKSATKPDTFTSQDGKTKDIDFMNRTAFMLSANIDNAAIVKLPYYSEYNKKHISMYLITSDKDYNAEELLKNATFSSKYIALSVPKFKIEYNTSLFYPLKAIGINKAFDIDAEFNKMLDQGTTSIGNVLHKTYIDVDENGTEAAAVTAFSAGNGMMTSKPEPTVIKFNKPFTFVIKDDASDEILFIGKYAFAQ